MGERVRAYRSYHERFDGRHQYRTSGRQRICRRTGGCGDDYAIGLIVENENAIDQQIEIHQPGDRALIDHRVIESEVVSQFLAAAKQPAIEDGAVLDRTLSEPPRPPA